MSELDEKNGIVTQLNPLWNKIHFCCYVICLHFHLDVPEIDFEAKIWELSELFSRCLQEYGRTGDTRMLIKARSDLCSADDENGDTWVNQWNRITNS